MKPIRFTAHAFERIFERGIAPKDCEAALGSSKVIESYPSDQPFPSELRIGQAGSRAIHLVVAETPDSIYVITAYYPDPTLWSPDFTVRRKKGGSQ
jgi:hypothetical protein